MSFGFLKKKETQRKDGIANIADVTEQGLLPRHIGIIMDGNGRWAKKRGMPRYAGHKYGAQTFREIVKHCETLGVEVVTVYAFSTENWSRSQKEVGAIMKLLEEYLVESLFDFKEENILTRFIGSRTGLSPNIVKLMDEVELSTKDRTGMILNIAVNYGGREEIASAVKAISRRVKSGELDPDEVDENVIANHIYTAGLLDPDMILRPSGEKRLSNFLIWQSAYAEFVFMDILWPDYKKEDLEDAILQYAKRDRRFGKEG